MEFFKKHWWKSDYDFPLSFILFFIFAGIFLGEHLPVIGQYLGGDPINDPTAKVSILDVGGLSDIGVAPVIYGVFGAVLWLLYRFLDWRLVLISGAAVGSLAEWFLFTGQKIEDRGPIPTPFGATVFFVIVWSIITLVPYFIYRAIGRKWGSRGRRIAILAVVILNILSVAFFAYEKYILHNSYKNFRNERESSGQQKPQPQNQQFYADFNLIAPYANEADISSINESFSNTEASPWGFKHSGIDFMTSVDLVPFRAVTDGVIINLTTSKESDQQGWHTSLCIDHAPYLICYNFETFSSNQAVGERQKANILIKNGDHVQQGDLIGKLVYGGNGAHVDFGVIPPGQDRSCPEPYFTKDAKISVLRLIHKDHPTWQMCYP